jgi:recombinational DNA repair protein RecR
MRIDKQHVKEIVLALSQTPEGEATAAYIAQKLKIKLELEPLRAVLDEISQKIIVLIKTQTF